ncbi:MAG TPA: hypothetical protein VGM82_09615 [Gemmatimonadaceae bacterium]
MSVFIRSAGALIAALSLAGLRGAESPPPKALQLVGDGVISTGDDEFGGSLTPNGDTIYFSKSAPGSYRYTMLESHRANGRWTSPTVLPFSGRYSDSDPTLSPDGRKMFWSSDRPIAAGVTKHDYDLWMVERTAGGQWGSPQRLPAPINSDASEYAASMASDGSLYFSSARRGPIEAYRSKSVNGKWTTPENLTLLIDGGDSTMVAWDLDVMIDPRQRFVLLGSLREQGFGNYDVYVSWKVDGRWTKAVHLPAPFNTAARDYAPHLTADGRTLFISSERGFGLDTMDHRLNYRELTDRLRGTLNGSGNIYEIDAAVLDAFRPASSSACPAAIAESFAWWAGRWNYAVPGFDPATSTITSSNDGCMLAEAFVDRTGQQQHTTIQYDSVAHHWKRHVVDPFRTYDSAGSFAADGSIAFYESKNDRESYLVTDHDHVHFKGEHSDDGGTTWKLLFDATYTRQPR